MYFGCFSVGKECIALAEDASTQTRLLTAQAQRIQCSILAPVYARLTCDKHLCIKSFIDEHEHNSLKLKQYRLYSLNILYLEQLHTHRLLMKLVLLLCYTSHSLFLHFSTSK